MWSSVSNDDGEESIQNNQRASAGSNVAKKKHFQEAAAVGKQTPSKDFQKYLWTEDLHWMEGSVVAGQLSRDRDDWEMHCICVYT